MTQPLIQFVNVFKRLGANQVLNGIDLSIFRGEITTIIGKSGSGKSVLLKHIIGLIQPDSGEILFSGKSLSKMKKSEISKLREKFSYVFQEAALFDSMTVYENIAFPLKEATSLPLFQIKKRVEEMMRLVDLESSENKYPSQVSGGMKRRVGIARALVTSPEVVLFDEPTSGLDPIRKNAVHSMICDYQRKFGFTGVMISHEIPDIFLISQHIAMLDEGRIRFEGSPEAILKSSDPLVQQFLQGLERPHDSLTGLPTHVQGERRFVRELARLQQHQIVFSVIMFTVENLEEINEKMGHVGGQSVLKNFAIQVQQRLDVTDFCSRYSLDKILVFLHNADISQAKEFSTRLAKEIKATDLLEKEVLPGLDITIGAGFVEAEEDSQIKELLAEAESRNSAYYEFRLS
jgi:phospholipid/cholesterol/gamma-HCH transport system ATP-binding protein